MPRFLFFDVLSEFYVCQATDMKGVREGERPTEEVLVLLCKWRNPNRFAISAELAEAMEFVQEELTMQYRYPRFFVTLACVPLLLSLCLSRVQAQEVTDISGLEDLTSLRRLTETTLFLGKQTASPPAQLGVEILLSRPGSC